MARNGSGTYNRPVSDYVFNTVISETDVNTEMDQIATALSDSIAKDGQTNPTANLPMATYKHTGVGNASARDQYAAAGQVQDSSFIDCGTAGGTKNALTLTPSPAITAYASGQTFRFKAGSTASDSSVTVAISGLATKAVEIDDSALSSSVVLEANKHYEIKYDGTAFQATRLSSTSGDFSGPASSTDNAIVRFDGTGGKTGQDSGWTISDADLVTAGGTLAMADNLVTRPKIQDYGETHNAIGSIGGGTQDIDITLGNDVSATVDTATTTFTFSNPSASGTTCSFTLELTNGGSQTVNWPASVRWPGGTAPSLTASGVDILTFRTRDGGTTWDGFAAGLDMQ